MTTKIIHQIWLGSDLPQKFLEGMADWQLLNEGWKYMLWTQPLPDMYNRHLYDSAHAYVKPDAVWQMRSDLMRYEILYRYGGFYCDVDTKPLRPLSDLFDGLSEWAVAESPEWVSNTYLYSEPNNPIFRDLINLQEANTHGRMNCAAGVVTGPQYLTPLWAGHVDERTELWHPYSWSDVRLRKDKHVKIPENAYAIHEWEHSRQKLRAAGKRYKENAAREARGL